MDYAQIIGLIQQSGGVDRATAERAARATLQTLAERLPRAEARHLLAELPAEMKPWVYTERDGEPFGLDEFLDRVAKREDTDLGTALRDARAVFFALGRALGPDGVAHLASVLPKTFEPLLAEAQGRAQEIMPASEFWHRVAQRLGASDAAARQVTDAVLETLAERIAAGQVDDLIIQLDPVLHAPLRRGVAAAGPAAHRMALEEFLRRIAQREGAAGVDEAALFTTVAAQARAVLATLAEAVSTKEWLDVVAELPGEYRPLIPARPS